jgi:trehalose synthase
MEDPEENAAVVNAIQRQAAVVIQKSLAEGFGLTVTEAMWKARPVVASAVGGIIDQIIDGEHGLLLPDPRDLRAMGTAVDRLLRAPQEAARLGSSGRQRVTEEFLGDRHLIQWVRLLQKLR